MISKLLIRLLTVEALKGETLAGENVQSSLLLPINEIGEGGLPVIAVYTDTAKTAPGQNLGRDFMHARNDVTVAIEIGIFAAGYEVVRNEATGELENREATGIAKTDEGFEMSLDLIERRAVAVLQAGRSDWAQLWRRMVLQVSEVGAVRGAAINEGTRAAFRRVELLCQLFPDPLPGEPLNELYADVLAKFEADSFNVPMVTAIRAACDLTVRPDWQVLAGQTGHFDAVSRMLGDGPFLGGSENLTTAELEELSLARVDELDSTKTIVVTGGGATIGGVAVEEDPTDAP